MLIIMNKDGDKQLGQELEFKELVYNFVTLKARRYYVFYTVCRALRMVLGRLYSAVHCIGQVLRSVSYRQNKGPRIT
jgi:hypothetical protein